MLHQIFFTRNEFRVAQKSTEIKNVIRHEHLISVPDSNIPKSLYYLQDVTTQPFYTSIKFDQRVTSLVSILFRTENSLSK